MAVSRKDIAQVIECVLEGGFRKATKFVSPRLAVTATRRHKPDKRSPTTEVLLTIGKPNYSGRIFVKQCVKAGEPFPAKKIQLKAYPIRTKKPGAAARKP